MNIDVNKLFQEIGKMHIQILLLQEENEKLKQMFIHGTEEKQK